MKQAYLIIAHNNFEHLKCLLSTLDCKDVSFYINIDAKKEIPGFIRNFKSTNPMTILHERIINWGNQSQVLAEMDLFEKAFENSEIEWFHLVLWIGAICYCQKECLVTILDITKLI